MQNRNLSTDDKIAALEERNQSFEWLYYESLIDSAIAEKDIAIQDYTHIKVNSIAKDAAFYAPKGMEDALVAIIVDDRRHLIDDKLMIAEIAEQINEQIDADYDFCISCRGSLDSYYGITAPI